MWTDYVWKEKMDEENLCALKKDCVDMATWRINKKKTKTEINYSNH